MAKKATEREPEAATATEERTPDSAGSEAELDELEGAIGAAEPAVESASAPDTEAMLDVADKLAESPELVADLTPDDVADLLALGFDLVAERRGEHWRLQDREKERIAKWAHKAIQRHGLEWLGQWMPDVMTGLLLLAAVVSRVQVDRELAPGVGLEPVGVGG